MRCYLAAGIAERCDHHRRRWWRVRCVVFVDLMWRPNETATRGIGYRNESWPTLERALAPPGFAGSSIERVLAPPSALPTAQDEARDACRSARCRRLCPGSSLPTP